MKRYLFLLIIIPFLTSCGAGGGGGGIVGGSGDNNTSNKTNPVCSSTSHSAKIKIKEDGLYKITYLDLYNACVDLSGADLATLKMTNQGEEIAIDVVDDNHNSRFDDGDSIEFYGKAIPRGDNRFRFTETNVYWLSAEKGSRERIKEISSSSTVAQGPSSFLKVLHMEEDTWYEQKNYPEITSANDVREHWFWGEVFYTPGIAGKEKGYYIRDYIFSTPNLDKTGPTASLKLRLQSVSGSHHIKGYVNGKLVVDRSEQTWVGQETLELDVSYPASYLNNGLNLFRLESAGDTPSGIYEVFYLDWFEIGYDHTYQVEDDMLEFRGEGLIGLSNFTSNDMSVYEISDPANIKKIIPVKIESALSGYKALFSTPQSVESRLFALTETNKKSPFAIEAYTLADIRSRDADYLIITSGDFSSAITPLADYRGDQGYKVLTVTVRDIYDEFSKGIETPQAIKDFLSYAYNHWSTKPRFVLLVGDATVDYKDVSGYGRDYGVKSYVPAYLYNYFGLGEVPSDNWFADVSGDVLPEMNIGRIPAKSPADVTAVVDKIISHETGLPKSNKVTLVSDYSTVSGTLFETLSDSIAAIIPADYPVSKLYQRVYPNPTDFRAEIISAINSDPLIVNYTGHGSVVGWTNEDVFSSEDMVYLTNKGYPFVVALNCLNGYFVLPNEGVDQGGVKQYPSIGETFLLASGKGAVAVLAASSIGYPSEHDPLAQALYNIVFNQDVTLGEAVTMAKEAAYKKGKITEDIVETFIFFGDPVTKLK